MAGARTRNINIRSLNINKTTILMEIMNNTQERFKLNDARRDSSNIPHRTILVNFDWDENLLKICHKLSALKILKVEYITQLKNNSFIKFKNDIDMTRFIHLLKIQNYRFKHSATFMTLLKFNQITYDNQEFNVNRNNDERRQVMIRNVDHINAHNAINNNNSVVIPEDIKVKIDNIADNLATVVNDRNNNVTNMPSSYLFNNLQQNQINPYLYNLPSNSNAFNMHNMNFLANQYPTYNYNTPFMNGLIRPPNLNFPNFPHFF